MCRARILERSHWWSSRQLAAVQLYHPTRKTKSRNGRDSSEILDRSGLLSPRSQKFFSPRHSRSTQYSLSKHLHCANENENLARDYGWKLNELLHIYPTRKTDMPRKSLVMIWHDHYETPPILPSHVLNYSNRVLKSIDYSLRKHLQCADKLISMRFNLTPIRLW